MNNAKWTLFAVGYQLLTGYALALIIYQFGRLFTGNGFSGGTAAAAAALAGILYLVFRRPAAEKGRAHGVS
jgi:ferrous iron transport protein B